MLGANGQVPGRERDEVVVVKSRSALHIRRGALLVCVVIVLGVAPAVAADEVDPSVVTLEQVGGSDALDADIAADGDVVHLVWQEGRFRDPRQIYYQQVTLGSDVDSSEPQADGSVIDLSGTETASSAAAIAVAGLAVHVVWVERVGLNESSVMYRRSDDVGRTWNEPVSLVTPDEDRWFVIPEIAASGNDIHVVYTDSGAIRYLRSHDRGATWEPPALVGRAEHNPWNPVVISTASSIHVAWRETAFRRGEPGYLRYSTSEDGVTWSEPFRIAEFMRWSGWNSTRHPGLAVSDGVVHAAWETAGDRIERDGGGFQRISNVMYRRSLDGGATWQDPVQFTDGMRQTSPTLTAAGDDVQIVAVEDDDLILLRSRDGGTTWDEPFVWSVPGVGALRTLIGDWGIHLVYRQRPEVQGKAGLSYAHVDLGFEPPPVPWRHIGVA